MRKGTTFVALNLYKFSKEIEKYYYLRDTCRLRIIFWLIFYLEVL